MQEPGFPSSQQRRPAEQGRDGPPPGRVRVRWSRRGPIWLWIIPLWFRLWFPPVMLNLRRQDVEPGHAGTGHHAVCRQSCGIAFAGMAAAEHAEQFRQLLALVG